MQLTGQMDLPVVGSVDKRVVLAVGGLAAAFVGWRYWQARGSAGYDPAAVDPGMEDPGVLPSVSGAVRDDGAYGLPDGEEKGADSYGFKGTTDSQWTQYAASQLVASDRWSYTDIVVALGKYTSGKALSRSEQEIVQAAIAVAGRPPEHPTAPVIPGGDTKITVAPTGVKVLSTTTTSVTLGWNAVAGAQSYRAYRGTGSAVGVTDAPNTRLTVTGLKPNTEYGFQIAADSIGDLPGPKSATVKGKTKSVKLKAPTNIRVSSVTKSTAKVSWSGVPGADHYLIYINGVAHGSSDHSPYTVVSLRPRTRYSVTVKADTTSQGPGPASRSAKFTTRKK